MDNVTNASAVLLIHNNTRGANAYYADYNFENYTVLTGRTNITSDNLTIVIQMLKNGTIMIIDNFKNNQTMTFIYDFTYLYPWWPEDDFLIIGGWNTSLYDMYYLPDITWAANYVIHCVLHRGWCYGFIIYENYLEDVHNMDCTSKNWIGWGNTCFSQGLGLIGWPWLQMFFINKTVGEWLENNATDPSNTISGYFEQEFIRENHWPPWNPNQWTAGVVAYNVEGNITIDKSPNDAMIIVSNRFDGWWGECPGDSGAGTGIALGIAKYFKDYDITPKYNLTFLFTTAEEYGFRGAWHYSHSHPEDEFNIIRWIGLDQLGFKQTVNDMAEQVLIGRCKNNIDEMIFNVIAYDSDYYDRTSYNYTTEHAELGSGHTDDVAWLPRDDCDTIAVFKGGESGYWSRHHRTGMNYVEGDSMRYMDRNDTNVTFELVWNLTKYYTVDPDCWFDSYSATAFDSPNDNDTKDDSVNITFSLKTILPNDKIRVKTELRKINLTGEIVDNCTIDYVINTTGINDSIILSVPENAGAGFYTCRFYLYNSTGRINEILNIGLPCLRYNDSRNNSFFLYRINENMVTPYFYNVGCSSQSIGYGSSNTISGCVSSTVNSTINQVQFYVLYPDDTFEGYNMTKSGGDNVYEILFNNTWQNGEHQYCIWAIDENGNSSISDWYSFNTSIHANISIATLQDNYGRDEFIDITDPPNTSEDYTLVDQGFTWNKYYDAVSGNNILEIFTEPVNYQDDNGTWTSINCSLQELVINHPAYSYGYRFGNEHGLYNVYFKPNIQNNWPVAFAYNKSDDPSVHVVRSKLVGVGYLDPGSNWAYEYLQGVQGSQGQYNDNKVVYENVFTGTDVVWSYDNTMLKEKIILSNTTKSLLQNHPPSLYGLQNSSSYLVFITKLDYQNLIMYNESGVLNGNVTVSDWIGFKDNIFGYFKCAMPIGDAYELYNESVRHKMVYRVLQYNGNYYLLSGLKVQDLNNMSFPVVIDPTITISGNENDGFIYKSSSNYNTAWSTGEGIISIKDSYISVGQSKVASFPPDYRIRRGFLFFNTSELPSNAYIESAVLSLYKKDDYSDTDFTITVQNGQPDYPHDPLEERDYNKDFYSGNGGELNTLNFVNGYNNITLTNLSWINVGGVTKLCLRSERDISGTAPTGSEYVNVYSANVEGELNPDPRPKLVIVYRNQSKIKNTGLTNITGYLLIQVQYLEDKEWVVDHNTVDETSPRTIPVGEQLALDTIFNGLVNTNDLNHGSGLYRVYAAFRDPDGDVLVCDDDSLLETSYEFTFNI